MDGSPSSEELKYARTAPILLEYGTQPRTPIEHLARPRMIARV